MWVFFEGLVVAPHFFLHPCNRGLCPRAPATAGHRGRQFDVSVGIRSSIDVHILNSSTCPSVPRTSGHDGQTRRAAKLSPRSHGRTAIALPLDWASVHKPTRTFLSSAKRFPQSLPKVRLPLRTKAAFVSSGPSIRGVLP